MNLTSELLRLPAVWFYVFAAVVIVGGVLVVMMRDIVHCALALAGTFIGVAGIYVLLGADFLAAVQILIYVGAVTVLILFTIMLAKKTTGGEALHHNAQSIPALIIIIIFVSVIGKITADAWRGTIAPASSAAFNVHEIGLYLMRDYVLPFEIASVFLLVAMVGAIIIAKKDPDEKNPRL